MLAEEREVSILFDDSSGVAHVFSASVPFTKRLLKLTGEKDFVIEKQTDSALMCHFPKKWVKIRKPKQLSDETLQKLSERMKQIHKGK
jgi:hypothetical protein